MTKQTNYVFIRRFAESSPEWSPEDNIFSSPDYSFVSIFPKVNRYLKRLKKEPDLSFPEEKPEPRKIIKKKPSFESEQPSSESEPRKKRSIIKKESSFESEPKILNLSQKKKKSSKFKIIK